MFQATNKPDRAFQNWLRGNFTVKSFYRKCFLGPTPNTFNQSINRFFIGKLGDEPK